jgi:hypothetical protein
LRADAWFGGPSGEGDADDVEVMEVGSSVVDDAEERSGPPPPTTKTTAAEGGNG